MILYSKDTIVDNLQAMKKTGRMAHAFLLIGEKGVGKKVMATYISMLLLCENGNACGECSHCKRIEKNTHPDVIRPERSGKKLIYNKETIRKVCSDAFISPNDCDSKVYIFADCENIEELTQNLMLKLIEEPPNPVYFIFTAVNRSVFLPTILSRVITMGVNECSEEDAKTALLSMNKYTQAQIDDAILKFHGNIGNCIEYMDGAEIAEFVAHCKNIVDGMIICDEYQILKSLAQIGENRDKVRNVLNILDKIIRDACVIRLNSEGGNTKLIGCYPEGAQKLSTRMSFRRAENVHEAINNTIGYCNSNCNVAVAMSALGGLLV